MTNLTATIQTNKGDIHIKLFADAAPVTIASFINLAKNDFYKGLNFHRVIDNFMIQGGCPTGTGTGGPGYRFEDEFSTDHRHDAPGKLSMANAGPGTNGSQFFVTHVPCPHLDGAHTVFGEVISADDQQIVNDIRQSDSIENITIEGDVDEFLAQHADRVAEWNSVLQSA